MSSAKDIGSAQTQPHTHHMNSGTSQTSKYGTLSSQKAFFECFKSSSVKKMEERTVADEQPESTSDKENTSLMANTESHLNHLISMNVSTTKH